MHMLTCMAMSLSASKPYRMLQATGFGRVGMMQATALGRVGMMHDVAVDPGIGTACSVREDAW